VIHGHWTTLGILYMYIAKKNKIKYRIAHSHSCSASPNLKGFVKTFLAKQMKYVTNFHFACSNSASKWLYGTKKLKNSYCHKIVRNAIDIEQFSYNKSKRVKYRKKLKIYNKYVLGHIGRFNDSKNQDFIIDIFNYVYKMNNNSVLVFIGDGPDRKKIESKVRELGLTSAVHILGIQEDILGLLSMMDLFIFPSKFEALGIAVIEAQAVGIPTLVSDAIPSEALITNNIESLPLSLSAKAWAEKVLLMSSRTVTDTHEDIRRNGYDVKEQANSLENFYLKLI